MLTGAIWTRNKYAFQYGRLLVRMKTKTLLPAIFLLLGLEDSRKMGSGLRMVK